MKYIVAGGTSGIGLATTRMAMDAGHEVIAVGRDPAKFSAAMSLGAATAKVDAANLAASRRFFDSRGTFDHLVLCASGSAGAGGFRELALDDLREGFEGKAWPQIIFARTGLGFARKRWFDLGGSCHGVVPSSPDGTTTAWPVAATS